MQHSYPQEWKRLRCMQSFELHAISGISQDDEDLTGHRHLSVAGGGLSPITEVTEESVNMETESSVYLVHDDVELNELLEQVQRMEDLDQPLDELDPSLFAQPFEAFSICIILKYPRIFIKS